MLKKRTRVLALVLSVSLILPGMAQGVPTVVKAESKSSVPGSPSANENGIMTWDCIYFGNYWQRDTNGDGTVDQKDAKEPIKWRVLSVEGNDAFLMADQPLDCRKYSGNQNDFNIDIDYEPKLSATWEDCSLRTWLNETFYQDAFSPEEGAAIQTVTVTNENNPITGINGGNNTEDKVYLLSLSEAVTAAYGFSTGSGESVSRAAEGTKYAENNDSMDFDLDSYWWLRSPGDSQTSAGIISPSGQVGINGMPVDFAPLGVRPVLHIDLSASSVWERAGTVTGTQPATPSEEPVATLKPLPTETPKQTLKPEPTPAGTTKPTAKPAPTTTMQPGEKKAISSFEDLQAMEDIPSGDYYLTQDITVPANTQLFRDYRFTGTLDGRGHKINGFKVQKKCVLSEKITRVPFVQYEEYQEELFPEPALAGLFCGADKATFQNLSLTNVDINVQTEANATVGALVTNASDCKFSNIHVSGKISVQSIRENPLFGTGFTVGGIVGGSYGSTMTNCSNSASISVKCKNCEYAGGASVGGLCGDSLTKITKCSNSGNVSLEGYCGSIHQDDLSSMFVTGLVPWVEKSVTSCTNSGNVSLKVPAGNHELPVGEDARPGKVECDTARAAGITLEIMTIESSGNTGKISLNCEIVSHCQLAGLVCKIGIAKKCYNKGTLSFSGKANNDGPEEGLKVGGLFADPDRRVEYQISECYNKGKVTVKAINGYCMVGGIVGCVNFDKVEAKNIQNCYNAGKISVKAKSGVVGGIIGEYYSENPPKGKLRYTYNVGKITASKKCKKGAILGLYTMTPEYIVKCFAYNNYYKGSGKVCGYHNVPKKKKKCAPKAKKVSSIKRAKCPKLSSKYWVYSSKVKRLILKNNKETTLGIKAEKTKKTAKKTKKKTTKKTKKKTTKKTKKKTKK